MNTLRVLLADDHVLVRSGIRLILESIEGMQVVAEAETGHQALEFIKDLRPDIALMDISMPGCNGIHTAAQIKTRYPQTKVMILSMHAGSEYVEQALRSGASGYLLKDASPMELELALKAVSRGETYLSPRISKTVVGKYLSADTNEPSQLYLLTPRQREILRLIAEGRSTKQIAAQLDVSVKTVETHRNLLMERLDIHGLAGLVRFAVRTGLVQVDR